MTPPPRHPDSTDAEEYRKSLLTEDEPWVLSGQDGSISLNILFRFGRNAAEVINIFIVYKRANSIASNSAAVPLRLKYKYPLVPEDQG
jgi:hypothetical protein